jgi:CheY-like chemotaxis protein
MNILLADDSVPAQNMGKKILMDAGYGVVTVNNGLEALRKIAETVPDIAILDIFMPGYTGLEICKRLRASAETASIPVILTVGKLEPYRPEDGEEVQSNAVIVKPFAAAELISAVRSLIGRPPMEAAAHPGEIPGQIKAASDPLQESPLADDGQVFPAPPVAVAPAAAEPTAICMDEADEPLFANPDAPSVYSSESPVFGNDANAPASLVFDPDAKRTPFSASFADPLSPASQPETEMSAFTEFNLAPEPSAHSALVLNEAVHEATHEAVHEATHGAAQQEATHAPAALHAVELNAGAPLVSEPDSPAEQIPAHLAPWEAIASETPTSAAAPPISDPIASDSLADEEARRAAFEALFNSAEESVTTPEALPHIAELPAVDTDSIELEMEAPLAEHPQHVAFAEVQLEGVQSEPLNEISVVPELDNLLPALLEDTPASAEWPEAATGRIEETVAPAAMETPLAIAPAHDVGAEPTAMLETHRVHESAPAAGIMTPALELAAGLGLAEASQASPVTPLEVMQAETQPPAPEPLHPEAKMPVAEAMPVRVEVPPVQVEAAQMQEAIEAAEPLQSAPLEVEQSSGDISSPPAVTSRLSEAERIHHAIELVFDRFKPLLVAAIVRELARQDK